LVHRNSFGKNFKANSIKYFYQRRKVGMKISEMMKQDVYAEGEKIGEVKDVYLDANEWEVTHLEVQLTKEAAREIFGAKTSIRNMLAIKALGKGSDCCTKRGIEIGVSKSQLHIYLRPPE